MESIIKKFQIDNRPKEKILFINLDPDVALEPDQVVYWVNLFNNHNELVVEIIENSDDESVTNVEHFMEGIETQKDLDIAIEIGVDYVQGYFFKDKFINISK